MEKYLEETKNWLLSLREHGPNSLYLGYGFFNREVPPPEPHAELDDTSSSEGSTSEANNSIAVPSNEIPVLQDVPSNIDFVTNDETDEITDSSDQVVEDSTNSPNENNNTVESDAINKLVVHSTTNSKEKDKKIVKPNSSTQEENYEKGVTEGYTIVNSDQEVGVNINPIRRKSIRNKKETCADSKLRGNISKEKKQMQVKDLKVVLAKVINEASETSVNKAPKGNETSSIEIPVGQQSSPTRVNNIEFSRKRFDSSNKNNSNETEAEFVEKQLISSEISSQQTKIINKSSINLKSRKRAHSVLESELPTDEKDETMVDKNIKRARSSLVIRRRKKPIYRTRKKSKSGKRHIVADESSSTSDDGNRMTRLQMQTKKQQEEEKTLKNLPFNNKNVYVVSRILDHKLFRGEDVYYVDWLGFPKEYRTWEPRESFDSIKKINEFERNIRKIKKANLKLYAQAYPALDTKPLKRIDGNDTNLFEYEVDFVSNLTGKDFEDRKVDSVENLIHALENNYEDILGNIPTLHILSRTKCTEDCVLQCQRFHNYLKDREFIRKRAEQLQRLKAYEIQLHDKELQIKVRNDVDLDEPPPLFNFIEESIFCKEFKNDLEKAEKIKCNCVEKCGKDCPCMKIVDKYSKKEAAKQMNKQGATSNIENITNEAKDSTKEENKNLNYTKTNKKKKLKRLKHTKSKKINRLAVEKPRTGHFKCNYEKVIYECSSECSCGPKCSSKVVGTNPKIQFELFKTPEGKGWGVKTLSKITKGTLVCEYVGEIITKNEANKREKLFNNFSNYFFDMDCRKKQRYTIDATLVGNISHFFNHSCVPNMEVYFAWTGHRDELCHRICFVTCKTIEAGTELAFDYTGEIILNKLKGRYSSAKNSIVNQNKNGENKKGNCFCRLFCKSFVHFMHCNRTSSKEEDLSLEI